jgi:hypothetical protein
MPRRRRCKTKDIDEFMRLLEWGLIRLLLFVLLLFGATKVVLDLIR